MQQDYFWNVDRTPNNHTDDTLIVSTRQKPHRDCHHESDYKYTAAHIAFMEQQEGANMMQTYFKIEASLSAPQYRFGRGLQLFGDERYQAALKELNENLVGSGCIEVLPEADVTWEIKQIALGYLMFLKRKRNGKMKGRGCADGRPQREYI